MKKVIKTCIDMNLGQTCQKHVNRIDCDDGNLDDNNILLCYFFPAFIYFYRSEWKQRSLFVLQAFIEKIPFQETNTLTLKSFATITLISMIILTS